MLLHHLSYLLSGISRHKLLKCSISFVKMPLKLIIIIITSDLSSYFQPNFSSFCLDDQILKVWSSPQNAFSSPFVVLWKLPSPTAMVRVCPSKFHMRNPSPQGDGIWKWASERCLGHQVGALMNGINALIKEAPEMSSSPSIMWGHKKSATRNRALIQPCWLASWSQTASLQNSEK